MSRHPGRVHDGGDRCGSATESTLRRELRSPPRGNHRRGRRGDSGRAGSRSADRHSPIADPCGPRPTRHIDLPARESDKTHLPVIDYFPAATPVLDREIDTIETYLRALVDQMPGKRG